MKFSPLLNLGIVIVVFVLIQGWLLMYMFVSPHVFTSTEAYLRGITLDIRAPVSGNLQTVAVRDGQRVEEGELLFVIQRTVIDNETLRWRDDVLPIYAPQSGVISGIFTMRGTFVSGQQKLAAIIDNSPDALYVLAKLSVDPSDIMLIRRLMSATVHGDFLANGEPIDAIISSIEPIYDKDSHTLNVRLQLLRYPDDLDGVPLDLPVTAEIRRERQPDENMVIAVINWMFPFSQAQQAR